MSGAGLWKAFGWRSSRQKSTIINLSGTIRRCQPRLARSEACISSWSKGTGEARLLHVGGSARRGSRYPYRLADLRPVRRRGACCGERPAVVGAAELCARFLHAAAEHGHQLQGHRYYSPEHDRGLAWDDPDVNIGWPVSPGNAILSDNDRKQPTLANLGHAFQYKAAPVR